MDGEQKAELDRQAEKWVSILMDVKGAADVIDADPEMLAAFLRGEAGIMVSVHGVRIVLKPDEPELPGMYL